ncbi:alpha carbonic anhydrase 4 [Perilla frutescens var. frutescens]|nr:alpha carbonic anhydrase 4 [Perilla frutescens var. frutescens]
MDRMRFAALFFAPLLIFSLSAPVNADEDKVALVGTQRSVYLVRKIEPSGRWSAIIGKASGRWGRVTAEVLDFNSSPAVGTPRSLGFSNPSKSRVWRSEFIIWDESPFTYDSKKGPENWANLNPKWKTCAKGKLQSPIDLVDDRVEIMPELGILKRAYKPAPAMIKNRGHDIQVVWEGDAGFAMLNGTEYKLLQCHWHTPSEHTMNGKRFELEVHLVHNNSLGHLAVVGVVYKLGHPDPFLAKLLETIKTTTPNHEGNVAGDVNPWDIKFGSRKYYRYLGSLTVPPCTEGVLWTIVKKVRTVSREQVRALRDAVHDGYEKNARPTQKSDQHVYMYRPGTQG